MSKQAEWLKELKDSIMDTLNMAAEAALLFGGEEDWTVFYVVEEVREMFADAHAKVTEAIEVMQK